MDFSSFLLTIGDGTAKVHIDRGEDIIQIPQEYLVNSIDELVDNVFPNIEEGYLDKYYVSRRAILTLKNENVDKINEMIMDKFPGIGHTYLSADTITEEDMYSAYPTELLNDTQGWSTCYSIKKSQGWPRKWTTKWNMVDYTKTWSEGSVGSNSQWH